MRRSYSILALALCLPLYAAAGCGGSAPVAEAPEPPPADTSADMAEEPPAAVEPEEAPAEAPPPPKWADMNMEQKKSHMMKVVMPSMGKLFKEYDATKYADFSCATCHGPGAKEGKFDMPSASLPKLPAKGDFKALSKAHPKVMEFMATQVMPTMAKNLDMEPYSAETGTGFGCYGCHQSK